MALVTQMLTKTPIKTLACFFAKHRRDNGNISKRVAVQIAALITCVGMALSLPSYAQTSPPPLLGEETKGEPAYDETQPLDAAQSDEEDESTKSVSDTVFGTAEVTESRRENGQRYLIELEHSTGSKQYIEENDSDGKIESTSNDIEETPNLPKWKLGSW